MRNGNNIYCDSCGKLLLNNLNSNLVINIKTKIWEQICDTCYLNKS